MLDTKSSRFFVSEQEREKNNQIARLLSQLLEACAEHDVLISLSLTGDTEKANGETKIHFVNRTRDGISYWIYSSALVWNDAAAVNLYLKTALSQPNLSLVAKKLSIFPDKSDDAFSTPYQLIADLTEQSSIETTTGQTVTGAEAPYGLVFTQVGAQSLDDVVITWLDGSGIRRTSHVTKINNPEKVTFNWKRPRDPFR